jgi:hypothetical protein
MMENEIILHGYAGHEFADYDPAADCPFMYGILFESIQLMPNLSSQRTKIGLINNFV